MSPNSSSGSDAEYDSSKLSQREVNDRGEKQYIKALAKNSIPLPVLPKRLTVLPLQTQILTSIHQQSSSRPGFMPRGLLEQILSFKVVLRTLRDRELRPHGKSDAELEQYAHNICHDPKDGDFKTGFRKIFAILILIDRDNDIFHFVDDNVSDNDLPLEVIKIDDVSKLRRGSDPKDAPVPSCLERWGHRPAAFSRFAELQWSFISPFFAKCKSKGKVRFYLLSASDILPWTTKTEKRAGGYSEVSQVSIHPSHHNFDLPKFGDGTFAVKKFRPGIVEGLSSDSGPYQLDKTTPTVISEKNLRQAFQLEVEILMRFSNNEHSHLVSLLAAIQKGNNYYLLFDWAQSDLLRFWKNTSPGDALDKSNLGWLLEQCRGVVEGLTRIHTYKTSETSNSPEFSNQPIFGRHGDIKPENFLLFGNGSSRGTLKISDFGLARFHSESSRTYPMKDTIAANTPTYRPPECDMKGSQVSRAFDIWSLGCVFLEFLTWHLGGWSLLKEFVHGRKTRDIYSFNSDQFFEIVQDIDDRVGARLKWEVWEWFNKLHNHPSCCDIIHEFLDLIEKDMLVVEPNESMRHTTPMEKKRADSRTLLTTINRLCRSLKQSRRLTPSPRRRFVDEPLAVEVELHAEAQNAARARKETIPRQTGQMKTMRDAI